MKKLQAFAKKVARIPLPALVYGAVLVVWLAVCTVVLLSDSVARANGSLTQQELTVDDFRLVELQTLPGGVLVSTTNDPQMILDYVDGKARTLRFSADFSAEGYEMSLYYTTEQDAAFDKDMRVWPVQQDDGSYLFTLPRQDIQKLRLDPASREGIAMDFHEIVLNKPTSMFSYYNPGWAGLFQLLLLPGMAAAVLGWLVDMARHYGALVKQSRWYAKWRGQRRAKKGAAQ